MVKDSITARVRGVSQDKDPIAYREGLWEVVVEHDTYLSEVRYFGPDTLFACLEANQTLSKLIQEQS